MNRDAAGGQGMTQFGRALAELNIEILCANSSQAKGRVERANRTLQDRLVKELRLAEISGMEAGNDFLPAFMERFNERFSVVPAKPEDLHRSLSVRGSRLKDILCHREQRHVSDQLTLSYDRRQIILERSPVSEKLGGQYVELYDFPDRPLEVRWKGVSLPYRVFEKDRRVSHAAVVENKRLGHALALVKLQQDLKRESASPALPACFAAGRHPLPSRAALRRGTVDPVLRSASRSSWTAVRSPRSWRVSTLSFTSSQADRSRCAGRVSRFPTGSSARISVSATLPW